MTRIPTPGAALRASVLATAVVAGLAVAAVLGTPHSAVTYPFGPPAGFAGDNIDPGEGIRTCATSGCHDSYGLNSGTGGVSITVPGSVQPGQTVPITITVNNTTTPAEGSETGIRQGFQAVVKDANNQFVGTTTITDPATTRFPGDGAEPYVSQRTLGTMRTSWTFDWTAPSTPGPVTVYAVGNAANGGSLPDSTGAPGGNNASGDYIYSTTQVVQVGGTAVDGGPAAVEALALTAPHPNPVRAGVAVLRLTLAEAADVRVRIVDGRGRTVRRVADARRASGETALTVRTAGLAPGLYFIVAETPTGRATQPLTVAR